MYEVVYRVGSELESFRVIRLLADHDIQAIVPEGQSPDPTLTQISAFSNTLPIAVPADQAEQARRVLSAHDAPREEAVRRIDRLFKGWMLIGLLLAGIFFYLAWRFFGRIDVAALLSLASTVASSFFLHAWQHRGDRGEDEEDGEQLGDSDEFPDRWRGPSNSPDVPIARPRPSEDGTGRGGHRSLK